MSLAERLAPKLPSLVHPGDAETEPFPLIIPSFQTATLPEGMAADMADELGMPSPDICLHFLEAVFALVDAEGVEMVDKTELAELKAAAAVNETKRNQIITFHTNCGAELRAMARGFDTEHPTVPCDLVNHTCKAR